MPIVQRLFSIFTRFPRKTVLLIGGLFFLGTLLFWLTRQLASAPLELTSSRPASGAGDVPVATHQITLIFSRPLASPEEVQINTLPPLSFAPRLETTRNVLTLVLDQPLLPKETYSLEVLSTKTGKSLAKISFTTQTLDTEGKGDPNIGQKLLQKEQADFPLLHWVPYETTDFSIDYLAPLALEVTVKTSREAAEADVQDWIRSHGVDPTSHEIKYIAP